MRRGGALRRPPARQSCWPPGGRSPHPFNRRLTTRWPTPSAPWLGRAGWPCLGPAARGLHPGGGDAPPPAGVVRPGAAHVGRARGAGRAHARRGASGLAFPGDHVRPASARGPYGAAAGRTMPTGHGAWCSKAAVTDPRAMLGIPPRPRAPTTTIWASAAASSSTARGDPWLTCHTVLTSGCFFSQGASSRANSSSIWRAPATLPGASASAQIARRGMRRNAASSPANSSAACEAGDPSTPTTTRPGSPSALRVGLRTMTIRPCPCPASCQATEPSSSPASRPCRPSTGPRDRLPPGRPSAARAHCPPTRHSRRRSAQLSRSWRPPGSQGDRCGLPLRPGTAGLGSAGRAQGPARGGRSSPGREAPPP
jgi:hypothetical protein